MTPVEKEFCLMTPEALTNLDSEGESFVLTSSKLAEYTFLAKQISIVHDKSCKTSMQKDTHNS